MGQREVIDFLKKNKEQYYTAKEISEKINSNLNLTLRGLRILREWGLVNWKISRERYNKYEYRYKDNK